MSRKLLLNNIETNEPPTQAHAYQTYTNYPIEVSNDNICDEHESYLTEIYGNTVNGANVGDSDGYEIKLHIFDNEYEFGKGGRNE